MSKILGLDLGSSSIGWALRNEDNSIQTGVITFDSGMVKEAGGYTSPTKKRREARSKRRLLQARKYRKWKLLEILIENDCTPLSKSELKAWSSYKKNEQQKFPENEIFQKWLSCNFSYQGGQIYANPYELRVLALDNKVSKHEFGRALYHLVQRRGYKNIGESDTDELNMDEAKKDMETKKQLERREADGFGKALQQNRTLAEALKKEFLDKGKRARNQYPLRKEYRAELELLCKAQGFEISRNTIGAYQEHFVQQLWKAIIWQRPLRSQKGNIGRCTLEKDRPRCPVSHPLFEIFRVWQFINTIKFKRVEGEMDFIPDEIRAKLYDDFFLKKNKNVKFSDIRKFLDNQFKNKLQYNYKDDHSAATMPICKGLIDIFGEPVEKQLTELHNYIIGGAAKDDNKHLKAPKIINENYSVFDLWHALYSFDEPYLKYFAVHKLKITDETTKKGRKYNPFVDLKKSFGSSFSDLSIKAISKIIPFLIEGHLYNEAVLLAKMPEQFGTNWKNEKGNIFFCIKEANLEYSWNKTIVTITNSLIDAWKGLENHEKYAYKDTSYRLKKDDENDIQNACIKYFGEKTWANKSSDEKSKIHNNIKSQYQLFFEDFTRSYRQPPTLDDLLKSKLTEKKIDIDTSLLYHHSKIENKYNPPVIEKKSGKKILSVPLIDSIKNPMFNKALTVLRKLLNELILKDIIDEETEVVIEVASELNDNNKRIAIEKYQRDREDQRALYRMFLEEFKEKENLQINVDKRIEDFELWNEQIFGTVKIKDEKDGKEKEIPAREYILKQKDAVKRYELWTEQKGMCMYTGKMISIAQLFSNEIDIEHTIPRSLLPDNTMANQTVCYAWYNRDKKKKQFPTQCANYSKDQEGWGTAIEPRLENWINLKEHYENLYEDLKKAKPGEDEESKNKRIQKKHEFKMYFDYWADKIERFTCEEIKESWVRRQLTDTQMISKYAREFLSTYFKTEKNDSSEKKQISNRVKVQKGVVTADFRKIFGFQEEDEIKNRNKHTHHAIDAAVLTLIPTNSSYRERLLKTMYEWQEQKKGQYTTLPFQNFSSQELMRNIETSVLVVNYQKDKILKRTYKTIRNRGRIVYVKNKTGNYVVDENNNKIPKIAKGDSIRTSLYKQTFVAKLRDVERDENLRPLRDKNGKWKFKTGKDEFFFAERVSIEDAKKYSDDIIDPKIKELVKEQKNEPIIKDYRGKIIRHVRIRTSAGKAVKKRNNYFSKNDYKNNYYAASGSLPYAAFLQNSNNGKMERIMIPISSAELGRMYKKNGKFEIAQFISEFYPEYNHFADKKLLKVGQKVFVLNKDLEFEQRNKEKFQINRLYVITQFHYTGNKIMFRYHLESRQKGDIDNSIKEIKSNILKSVEQQLSIPEINPNESITIAADRKKDFEARLYNFSNRIKIIAQYSSKEQAESLKTKIEEYKTESSVCNDTNPAPILGLSRNNWNFLLEDEDFEISLSGEINWDF
ncbi:MAG: hypothetical protein IT214_03470 [Chitinophagaceae bacterium]|nr:hypothetical protein [Chitinophagaceae bacterium]